MELDEWIRLKVKCCACGGSLKNGHINLMALMKQAKWKYPCWGNILLRLPPVLASAIICDDCLKKEEQPKFAVELDKDRGIVKYHPVEELVDVPPEIFEPLDELEPGRHGIAG